MSSIIPNSTPTPNFYYDELMYLLSANEWAVLSYATRRIFGFEKGRIKYKAIISLSTFDDGVNVIDEDTGDNIRLAFGCMLSRPAIKRALDELVKYGIMLRGPVTKDGQVWELQVDENKIDIAGLEKRLQLKTRRGRKRIAKAVKTSAQKRKKEAGTQDVPLVSEAYQTRYAQPTEQGSDGVHIESKGKASVKQDSGATAPRFAIGDWVDFGLTQATVTLVQQNEHGISYYVRFTGDTHDSGPFYDSELTPLTPFTTPATPPTPPDDLYPPGMYPGFQAPQPPGTQCSMCGHTFEVNEIGAWWEGAWMCMDCYEGTPDPPTEPAAQAPADDGESEDAQDDDAPVTSHNDMKNLLAEAQGLDVNDITVWGEYDKASKLLRKVGATRREVIGTAKYCRKNFKTFGPMAIAKNIGKYRASHKPAPTTRISNERDTGAVFDVFAPRFDVDGRYIPEDDPDAERTAA